MGLPVSFAPSAAAASVPVPARNGVPPATEPAQAPAAEPACAHAAGVPVAPYLEQWQLWQADPLCAMLVEGLDEEEQHLEELRQASALNPALPKPPGLRQVAAPPPAWTPAEQRMFMRWGSPTPAAGTATASAAAGAVGPAAAAAQPGALSDLSSGRPAKRRRTAAQQFTGTSSGGPSGSAAAKAAAAGSITQQPVSPPLRQFSRPTVQVAPSPLAGP